jgi:hypothetical protein
LLVVARYRRTRRPLGIRCSFRVPGPATYRDHGFREPTMPLAVSSAAWSFVAGLRRSQLSDRQRPLCEFRVPPAYCPTRPSPSAAAGERLSWAFGPFSTRGIGGPLAAGVCQRPLRSALRVWLPSRRFTPSEPLPVLFHTGGAHGIRPAELSPAGRYPPRFRGSEPTYRFTCR